MKYEKNQYTEGLSWCSLLIAGAFFFWGFNTLRERSWIGILWIGIGFSILSGQYYAFANRGKLKNIVLGEFSRNPNVSVNQIMQNTGISRKDVKAIILDLKGSGKLRGTFSPETGQMQTATVTIQTASPTPAPAMAERPEITKVFCKDCGTELGDEDGAKFCPYCGSQI